MLSKRIITPALLISLLLPGLFASADELKLRPDHPDRYVVKKGDTLWDISAKFLQSPWNWPKIWNANPEVKSSKDGERVFDNPHLIYPGDILVFRNGKLMRETIAGPPREKTTTTYVGPEPGVTVQREEYGERRKLDRGFVGPTVRLRPKVHEEPITEAIPTIPPEAIQPFLNAPLVVGRNELKEAGYITVGVDNRLIIADGSEFYARGLSKSSAADTDYRIFRQGQALRNPQTGKVLAYEATYLGDAKMITPGDPAKLVITSVRKEILPKDRLLVAAAKQSLPYYQPHAPKKDLKGWILAADDAVSEIGPNVVVAISLGRNDGIEDGNVLRIMRHVGKARDPVTGRLYSIPDEQSGLLMVFRTNEEVSYGLIMEARRSIHLFDTVETP
jgi:hypothetical protein